MAAIQANARNFLQNSDYPQDKVTYLKSGQLTIPTTGLTIPIPHTLGYSPLVDGGWSLTPDFFEEYEFGTGTFPSAIPGRVYNLTLYAYSDASNIYIDYENNSGSSQVIYYRITGEQPNDVNVVNPATASQGDTFSYNSDYNYPKILLEDNFNPGASTSIPVFHNLGYKPQARLWHVISGLYYPSIPSLNFLSGIVSAQMTTSAMIFALPGSSVSKVYYKVYLDE